MENGPQPGDAVAALLSLARKAGPPRFSLGELVDALGEHGYGLLLLILAIPNFLPGPVIPGFSVPFAIGIALLGLQRLRGDRSPRLPRWLRRFSIRRDRFVRLIDRMEPHLLRLQRWLRPRPGWLTEPAGQRLVGAALVWMSLVLALPVPFGNAPLGLAIAGVAFGLLEDDGYALFLGLAAGIAAILWNGVVVFAGERLIEFLAHLR
jgi:hypothetical protein